MWHREKHFNDTPDLLSSFTLHCLQDLYRSRRRLEQWKVKCSLAWIGTMPSQCSSKCLVLSLRKPRWRRLGEYQSKLVLWKDLGIGCANWKRATNVQVWTVHADGSTGTAEVVEASEFMKCWECLATSTLAQPLWRKWSKSNLVLAGSLFITAQPCSTFVV